MKFNEMFPSKYLKASDLADGPRVLTISDVAQESFSDGQQKWVVYFSDHDKALVLNKTNAGAIAKATGSQDTNGCIGKRVHLFATEVGFRGDMVDAVRVSSKVPPSANAVQPDVDQTGDLDRFFEAG